MRKDEIYAIVFFSLVLLILLILLIHAIYDYYKIKNTNKNTNKNPLNSQLLNKVVYCETSEEGKKIIQLYNDLGYYTKELTGVISGVYYGLDSNNDFYGTTNLYMVHNYFESEIITFEELNKLLNK